MVKFRMCGVLVPIVLGILVALALTWSGRYSLTEEGRIAHLLRMGTAPQPPPPRWLQRLGFHIIRVLEAIKNAMVPPDVRLLEKIVGLWTAKSIYAAAELGIADVIPLTPGVDGWPTAFEIGEKVGVKDKQLMYRFLRALASLGILREHPGQRFSHTEYSLIMGERSGVRSAKSFILTWGGGQSYAWDGLANQLLTGENAFQMANGVDLWEYYKVHQEEEQYFQRMLGDLSKVMAPPLVMDFDWPAAVGGKNASVTIADVGGGLGSVLALVMSELPNAKGILFDLASVIGQASQQECWKEGPLADRVTLQSGSFFEKVPEADIYLLRSILHDWNDEMSIAILKSIRRVIKPGGKLFLMEHLLPPTGQQSNQLGVPAEMVDLHMLVLVDGKERTALEFQQLLNAAGFVMVATHFTRGVFHLVEAVPSEIQVSES